jgi:hypothetical protein
VTTVKLKDYTHTEERKRVMAFIKKTWIAVVS